jgi:hydrogenase-4 component B
VLNALLAGILVQLAASLAALAGGRQALVATYALSAGGAALAALAALAFLFEPPAAALTALVPVGLPWLGAHLRLDALAAFFLLLVNGVAVPVGIFAIRYAAHEAEPERALPLYPLFLAAMSLVLLADDAYAFLVSWELMSLASWLLVLANHRQDGAREAAFLYLVMASIGTAAMLLAFGVLAGASGAYEFAAIRGAGHAPLLATTAAALVLVGAGSKAGLVPLHAWLPLAHPAAPSHVSALMSGVMTKVAIYALIRILFDLLGTPLWWWGAVLLLVGGISAPLGVLYAILQRDLKTMLAYSTVENVGIIALALGLALAFKADQLPALAALALVAALFHALNHALVKTLLFLGAGIILEATGSRDIERMGGLIHRLKLTAIAFLVGAAAMAALPPLNGFASEWLVFQAILKGALLPQWLLKFAVPVVGALLALAAALAAVAFVRAFGIAFLGRPRSAEAADAVEPGRLLTWPLLALAALCALFGILPLAGIALIRPVVQQLFPGAALPFGQSGVLFTVPLDAGEASYSGIVVAVALALMMALVATTVHRYASARLRRAPAWDCGFPDPRPQTQYTASSFGQPIRRVYATAIFGARERVDLPEPGALRPAGFAVAWKDRPWLWFYVPVARLVEALTERINVLQFLTIRRYLTLMFGALILLLSIVAVTQ